MKAIGTMGKNTLLKNFFFTLQYDGEYADWTDMVEQCDEEGNITPHEHLGLRIIGDKHMVLTHRDGYWKASAFKSSTGKVISVEAYDPLCALLGVYLEYRWGVLMPTPLELMSEEVLCQDLEAKLFKWFESRLDATKIKREAPNARP